MTVGDFFQGLVVYRMPILVAILLAPWFTWLICALIPGRREEPFLLSVNIGFAVTSLLLWAGYLAYATNTGGWERVVKEADILLLFAPPYYLASSVWVASKRVPLLTVPAYRALQGLATIAGAFLVLSWILGRIRIILFSYIPFSYFLLILAGLLFVAYLGYLKLIGKKP
ncbi:hypothetical protein Pse7367_1813 [Thalassoporum mexicanum PCC 7367]|uniref:hypothetical protein n=1 Tax=Thalassoporum mexicanum TaxID=3457544 RepID=UPI00029F86A8|nr:hypothetical protein [Pseudanabaena sp. PCC 7367]AFY70090.1 hypothetical protein Pse7367_1813 [Pseudanabaena sp. PCC 7367]